jgi:hypothetical protein
MSAKTVAIAAALIVLAALVAVVVAVLTGGGPCRPSAAVATPTPSDPDATGPEAMEEYAAKLHAEADRLEEACR